MPWKRILILFALSGAVTLAARWIVPGSDVRNLLLQAGCLLLLPWLAAPISFPLRSLGRGLLDALRRAPVGGETSAHVLRSLGGLTWVAGLLALVGSFYKAVNTMAWSRVDVDVAAALPGIIPAMLVPVAFALVIRLTIYDPPARALEVAAKLDGADESTEPAETE